MMLGFMLNLSQISNNAVANVEMNLIAIAFLLVLLFGRRRVFGDHPIANNLFTLLICLAIMCASGEALSNVLSGREGQLIHVIYVAVDYLLFLSNLAFCYVWGMFVVFKMFGNLDWIKKNIVLYSLPALILAVLLTVNIFVPFIYFIDTNNIYSRLSFSFIPYMIDYGYMIFSLVIYIKFRNTVKRYFFFPMEAFMLPAFIGSIIQGVFFGVSVIWVANTIALNALYLNLLSERTFIDPLTGLYNRGYFNRLLKRLGTGDDDFASGLMIDLNDFKAINDNLGHDVGDMALKDVGELLIVNLPDGALAARTGGDEFFVLVPGALTPTVDDIRDRIEQAVRAFNAENNRPYTINFSIGTALYDPADGEDAEEKFLKRLDDAMFAVKDDYHGIHGSYRDVRPTSNASM